MEELPEKLRFIGYSYGLGINTIKTELRINLISTNEQDVFKYKISERILILIDSEQGNSQEEEEEEEVKHRIQITRGAVCKLTNIWKVKKEIYNTKI